MATSNLCIYACTHTHTHVHINKNTFGRKEDNKIIFETMVLKYHKNKILLKEAYWDPDIPYYIMKTKY